MGNAENNRFCVNCINKSLLFSVEPCKSCINNGGKGYNFTPLKDVAPSVNEKSVNDNVNHPSHYETGSFECIDVMLETQGKEAVKNFCLCNAFKYIYRHNNKNGLEDIQKAKWYIDKYIELSE
uniref:Nucelotide kinase n=1 Tax=Siphoviridae sp. ctu9a31 TaxID=2825712 RepID=A0A8S5Q8Y9_9CAUD|nr:MAG TPA: nucelotide kinase [Siphoviridae sp. ctu9a31]